MVGETNFSLLREVKIFSLPNGKSLVRLDYEKENFDNMVYWVEFLLGMNRLDENRMILYFLELI